MIAPNEDGRDSGQEHAFGRELTSVDSPDEKVQMEDLHEVRFRITADLGRCWLTVGEVLALERGTVLALDRQAGEMADILVNNLPIAKGEVVVLGDTLHVRIAEIRGAGEKELAGL